MKKIFTLIIALSFGAVFFAQTNTIAVPAPKTINIGAGNEWIPLFIQGVITSNFQQYSGMKVIDRQNSDMVKAEQRLSESAEFDEKTAIELGKMTSARHIITGSITGKASSYALLFNITDAETGETKASATVPNCLFSALENGDAANQISYDLMRGYGINLSDEAKKKLTQKATVMTSENSAQASVAKGIVAEQSGSNIEALTYYIQAKKNDKKFAEATNRMSNMSTVVITGNFGKNAKNMIKLRKDWDKLLLETTKYLASNPPIIELRYDTRLRQGKINYEKENMDLYTEVISLKIVNEAEFNENIQLIDDMKKTVEKIPGSWEWGEKINNFPKSYVNDITGDNWLKKRYGTGLAYADSDEIYRTYSSGYSYSTNHPNDLKTLHKYCMVNNVEFSLLNAFNKTLGKTSVFICFDGRKVYWGDYGHWGDYEADKIIYLSDDYNLNHTSEDLYFQNISINDADTDEIYISVKNPNPSELIIIGFDEKAEKERKAKEEAEKAAKERADAEYKMKECYYYSGNKNVQTIIIPEGYRSIAKDSFNGVKLDKLKSLTIPESVTSIDFAAMKEFKSLKTIIYSGTEAAWNQITMEDAKYMKRIKVEFSK